jgi:hypothetical protein
LADRLDRDALRQRRAADRSIAASDRVMEGRVEARLDPDDLDLRLRRFGRDRDAAISPPPPIGTTTWSSSGRSSSISSPTVPWPAMIKGSS